MPTKKENTEVKKELDVSFLIEWSKLTPMDIDEQTKLFKKYYEECVANGESNPYDEAKMRIYINLKSEMQSPATAFVGYIFGYTEPFDWTSSRRAKALEQYKLNPEVAIATGYVKIGNDGKVQPLFYDCSNLTMRGNVLEKSLIRTVYGICIKLSSLYDIELLTDIMNNTYNSSKQYKSLKVAEYKSGKVDLKSELATKWSDAKWFDLTISNEYADTESKKYIKVTNDMLFKHIGFRANIKAETEKLDAYVLNSSTTTVFKEVDLKGWFSIDFLRNQSRYLKIEKLDLIFNVKENYRESTNKDGKKVQTTNSAFMVEGILSGDPMPNQYSVIFNLDDLALGFNKDKKITLFMPLGVEKVLGKGSKIIVFGTLTRTFDTVKKVYPYPSVNVSSYYAVKIEKPVLEDQEAISKLQVESIPEVPIPEDKSKVIQQDATVKKTEANKFDW